MRGEELRAFLAGLRSRFPDLTLSDIHSSLLDRLEHEYRGHNVTFPELVSVLNIIADRPGGNGVIAVDLEATLRRRIAELERAMAQRDAEYRALHERFHVLQRSAVRAAGPEQSVGGSLEQRAAEQPYSQSQVERLRNLVISLVHATQLLSRDRHELYDQLLSSAGGANKLSQVDAARRLTRENELIDIYQKIMEGAFEPLPAPALRALNACTSLICSRRRPLVFGLYTGAVWLLGIVSCLLAGEYIGAVAYLYMAGRTLGAVY